MATPTYVYKIVPSDLIILPLPERLPLSPLDSKDRFIHLSTAKQLPGTLTRFFENENDIYILRIDYKNVENNIRWEESARNNQPGEIGGDGVFPHLYNDGRLGSQEVENVFRLVKDDVLKWDSAKIETESPWLIY